MYTYTLMTSHMTYKVYVKEIPSIPSSSIRMHACQKRKELITITQVIIVLIHR